MSGNLPITQRQFVQIQVEIYADKMALGAAAADFVAGQVSAALQARDTARVIFATGASQYEFLDALIGRDDITWQKVTAFHLDEYLGLPADHPAGFRRYLRERLFDRLQFGSVHLLDGNAPDPAAECRRYAALLAAQAIDVACIGIGENGHLAFNDPPADFETDELVHVVTLDDRCRRQQVGEGHFPNLDAVPPQALSLTIPAIMAARAISCVAADRRKAEPVSAALTGPITPDCPASILQRHPHCRMFLDPAAAGLLPEAGQDG